MSAGRHPRATSAAGLALLAVLTSAGCSAGDYGATPVPTPRATTVAGGTPRGTSTCSPSRVTSYQPPAALDRAAVPKLANNLLRVGVSADSLLLGSRNPLTGTVEGFDIDIAREVARAATGDPGRIQLVVITSAGRIDALKNDTVDLVARNMSMTCDRWTQIAFSAEYYQSGLKILVPKGSKVTSFAQLAGRKVCAPTGTSTIDFIRGQAGVQAVGAATHTGCLVLFQQGEVDAIAGDDTVLAGLVAQDPYAYVPPQKALTSEPYGLGVRKDDPDFVRFVNRVLDDMKADGRWKAIYDRWFAGPLGPAPAPPTSVYGR